MSRRNFSCYDVCCGAGIFALGFKKAGFEIIGGIDTEKYAVDTAGANIPEGIWEQISIEYLARIVEKDKSHSVFKADVIIAGLPCQGFSVAGKCDISDERNHLYKYLIRIIKCVNPEYVIIENVRGLLSERNRDILNDILYQFKSLGFMTGYRLYDAVNLGVPQYRQRVFIVASKTNPPQYIFDGIHFTNSQIPLRNIFAGLPAKHEIKKLNHTFMVHGKKVIKKISGIKDTKVISYRRLKLNKPSVTITSGHNALPVHPVENRAISIREAARIQGIPDSFIFNGTRTQQTVLVANAVPLPVTVQIAKAVKSANILYKKYHGGLFRRLVNFIDGRAKAKFQKEFIKFYYIYGINYPWRSVKDPFKILLTEILLQRTKGNMVKTIWNDVMHSVKPSGNGYKLDITKIRKAIRNIGIFSRINTLEQLNTKLSLYYGNDVPSNYDELLNLPGVGIYIAAAVRNFAFNIPDFPVDMNCFRFVSRYFGLKTYGRKSEAKQLRAFMNSIIPAKENIEFVYGFLDFCSLVCTPGIPKCNTCFLNSRCKYNISGS